MFSGVDAEPATLDFRVAFRGGGMRNLTTDRRSEENMRPLAELLLEIGWCSYTLATICE